MEIYLAMSIYINNELTRYTIDTLGNVKNRETCRFLRPYKNKKGYLLVRLYHKGEAYDRQVHRLSCEAFDLHRRVDQIQVNHIDGDKGNNNLSNLEYCNNSENQLHAHRLGLVVAKKGVDHSMVKYSEKTIHSICMMMCDGYKNFEIQRRLNLPKHLVNDTRLRRAWKIISVDYDF